MINQAVDILIVGGGLTGATLALALDHLGYQTRLIEARPFEDKIKADFDARSLALSPASVRILSMLDVWPILKDQATAIKWIHVSDQHRFGATRLQGSTEHPLGYVVEMQHINRALQQRLPKHQVLAPATLTALDTDNCLATVTHSEGQSQIKFKLIVAADGADSTVRQLCSLPSTTKDYKQSAIITNIGLANPHQGRAYERFTSQGPLALLPMGEQRMSLVWALSPKEAEAIIAMDEGQFLKSLQSAFGYRLGRFVKAGQRYTYPLKQTLMPKTNQWPVVFVGNAAHTLHPVAGQGFNLGLRDVAMLAQCIAEHGLNKELFMHYQSAREEDQTSITQLTDGLISLFTSQKTGLKIARTIGLLAMDNSKTLKHLLARYARGFGGIIPDLVCEIPLNKRGDHDTSI